MRPHRLLLQLFESLDIHELFKLLHFVQSNLDCLFLVPMFAHEHLCVESLCVQELGVAGLSLDSQLELIVFEKRLHVVFDDQEVLLVFWVLQQFGLHYFQRLLCVDKHGLSVDVAFDV